MKRAVIAALMLVAGLARASEKPAPATFALIVGVNQSQDEKLGTLRYADDDAARYQELFRSLGARTYLVTRLDDASRRLHPQAAAEAFDPVRKQLEVALNQAAFDVAQAKRRGIETAFLLVYAGHGKMEKGDGVLALEDGWLSGADLVGLVDRVKADHAHVVVDACYSYFLAYRRGPGGQRREVHGFSRLTELAQRSDIGLLLSTSSARESHEWEGFQAGVFSHEVRSGLYGAADVDGDGRVSYREIAAFVTRANEAVPNERFRPDLTARPPAKDQTLLDLRSGLGRRIEIGPQHAAHWTLEDGVGNVLAEFHNGRGQPVKVVRPAGGVLYLRGDANEYAIPAAAPDVVEVGTLEARPARTTARGAATDAFGLLFQLPFGGTNVAAYQFRPFELALDWVPPKRATWRTGTGWTALGVGSASLVTALWLTGTAENLRNTVGPLTPNVKATAVNDEINSRNDWAKLAAGFGGAAAVTGAILLWWPTHADDPYGDLSFDGQKLLWQKSF
jgi:hypothetical protein